MFFRLVDPVLTTMWFSRFGNTSSFTMRRTPSHTEISDAANFWDRLLLALYQKVLFNRRWTVKVLDLLYVWWVLTGIRNLYKSQKPWYTKAFVKEYPRFSIKIFEKRGPFNFNCPGLPHVSKAVEIPLSTYRLPGSKDPQYVIYLNVRWVRV